MTKREKKQTIQKVVKRFGISLKQTNIESFTEVSGILYITVKKMGFSTIQIDHNIEYLAASPYSILEIKIQRKDNSGIAKTI